MDWQKKVDGPAAFSGPQFNKLCSDAYLHWWTCASEWNTLIDERPFIVWPVWVSVLPPWNVTNDVCVESHVFSALGGCAIKAEQFQFVFMQRCYWPFGVFVSFSSVNTSHVLWSPSPVIYSLQVENLALPFTVHVYVLMRRFCVFFLFS